MSEIKVERPVLWHSKLNCCSSWSPAVPLVIQFPAHVPGKAAAALAPATRKGDPSVVPCSCLWPGKEKQ